MNPEVYEISPNIKLGHFPGYQNICIKHNELQQIVKRNEPSWKDALSNVKGVYVITDINNGQIYVGSASGNTEGLWQRWSNYAGFSNPTGGNKVFSIIHEKTSDYIGKYFQYSILEIFDTKTKREIVIERENYWKKVLDSKKHGMNHN